MLRCAQALLAERKRSDDLRIELRPVSAQDLVDRRLPPHRPAIGAVAGHCIECVGDGENTGALRNLFACKAVRIATPVPTFVVETDDLYAFAVE